MNQSFKLLGMLTLPQAEILKTLFELEQQTHEGRYWRARDLGAFRSSHHALTLKRLHERGYIERESSTHNFGYRIAQAGQSAWRLLRAASELPAAALMGGAAVQPRARALTRLAN